MSAAEKIEWSHEGPTNHPAGPRQGPAPAGAERELGVHMGAYSWIQRLGTRRGRTKLAEADKPLLMHMWSFAPWALRGDARAEQVRPSRARLAAETGATLSGLKKRLSRLAASGWIRRRGRGWDLAWQVPFTERAAPAGAELEGPTATPKPAPRGAGASGERPLNGPGSGPSTGRHDQTTEHRENWDQTNPDQFVWIDLSDPADGDDAESIATDLAHPPSGGRMTQQQQRRLFEQEREPDREIAPVRDRAREVFEHLRDRIIATKVDLGIKPARGPTKLAPADRKAIEARIREHDEADPTTPDAGVIACKQVIDVDEADCRRNREISAYWNATTPFRNARNFESRLLRWRADGKHQPFGASSGGGRPAHGVQVARAKNDLGWYPHMTVEERDAIWDDLERRGEAIAREGGGS